MEVVLPFCHKYSEYPVVADNVTLPITPSHIDVVSLWVKVSAGTYRITNVSDTKLLHASKLFTQYIPVLLTVMVAVVAPLFHKLFW